MNKRQKKKMSTRTLTKGQLRRKVERLEYMESVRARQVFIGIDPGMDHSVMVTLNGDMLEGTLEPAGSPTSEKVAEAPPFYLRGVMAERCGVTLTVEGVAP